MFSFNLIFGPAGVYAEGTSTSKADEDELNKDSNAFALNPFNANEEYVDLGDLSYLHKPAYDAWISSLVSGAKLLTLVGCISSYQRPPASFLTEVNVGTG